MGYTHYHYQLKECSNEKWAQIKNAANLLIASAPCAIQNDSQKDDVFINGVDKDAYETFELAQNPRELYEHEKRNGASAHYFCKTAHRPYDLVVCAILAVAEQIAPEVYAVSSDGGKAEWTPAVEFASKVLGYEVQIPADILNPSHVL